MKKKLWILLVLLMQQIYSSFGQEFAPIGAEWYYSSMAWGTAPNNSEYYYFRCAKDTIINDYALKKIDITYYRYQGDSVIKSPYFIAQRHDSVLVYNPNLDRFYRLYIFNAAQGDTLTLDIPYDNLFSVDTTFRVIIDTIIIETYDNTPLKKYALTQIDNFGWLWGFYLEKVGGYQWFLPMGKESIPEVDGPIRCYHDNEIDINFVGYNCDKRIINSIEDSDYEKGVEIYPNPTSGFVQIRTNQIIDCIEVTDISGKKLLETNLNTVDIKYLDKGIYLFKIISGKIQVIKKVIKNVE